MADEIALFLDRVADIGNIFQIIEGRLATIDKRLSALEDPVLRPHEIVLAVAAVASVVVGFLVGQLGYRSAKAQQKSNLEIAKIQNESNERVSIAGVQSNEKIKMHEMRASIISRSRIDWVESLRKNTSEFYGAAEAYNQLVRFHSSPETASENSRLFAHTWEKLIYLELMLNHEEYEHLEIIASASALLNETAEVPPDPGRRVECKNRFVGAVRAVLKAEWTAAKSEVRKSNLS
jgi:hypothetical protein